MGVIMVLKQKDNSSVTSSILICKIIPQLKGDIGFIFILCSVDNYIMTTNKMHVFIIRCFFIITLGNPIRFSPQGIIIKGQILNNIT